MSKSLVFLGVLMLMSAAGITPAQTVPDEGDRYITPAELPVYVLDAGEAFHALTEKEKAYAHWMSQASWLGAQITMAQVSREAATIHEVLLIIWSTDRLHLRRALMRAGMTSEEIESLKVYSARFFSNLGNYLAFGDTKFVPRCPPEKFDLMIRVVSELRPEWADTLNELWTACRSQVYSLLPQVRQLGLGQKGTSAYYGDDVSEEEVGLVNEFLVKRNISPYNTRVIKDEEGQLIIRTASMEAQPALIADFKDRRIIIEYGDFSEILAQVVRCLEEAALHAANDRQREMIDAYIRHFRTGNVDDHKNAMRAWVKDIGPVIETNLGFIESYRDPAGVRGEWEGLVAVVNREQTRKFGVLVDSAPKFIALLPWGATFEKATYHRPDFTSLDVLTFANCDIPAGINIPNYDDIRQNEGFKNVSLGNVLLARRPGKEAIPFIAESDQDLYRRWMAASFEVQVGLHELLGHGSGRLLNEVESGQFDFDRQKTLDPWTGRPVESWYKPGETWNSKFGGLAQTYEECRAEAVGLYLSTEPHVLEIFGHKGDEGSDVMYINWLLMARAGIDALRFYNPATGEWGQAHMQGRFALLNVMRRAAGGLLTIAGERGEEIIHLDRSKIETVGKPAVGEFLRRVMFYKSTGDFAAGKALYDDITRVSETDLKMRETVFLKAKPRNIWVQPVSDLDRLGRVILREYPATLDGVIESHLDRFGFLVRY